MKDETVWRPLEPGETIDLQLKPRTWGDRLKVACALLVALWGVLWRGEASMKVERTDPWNGIFGRFDNDPSWAEFPRWLDGQRQESEDTPPARPQSQ